MKHLTIWTLLILIFFWIIFSAILDLRLQKLYQENQSRVILDRFGKIIAILPNPKGYYSFYLNFLPERVKTLLIQKEDRFFYYHFGINPVSIAKEILSKIGIGKRIASSTITQQLAKNLLGNESKRGIGLRLKEIFYALALETWHSKEEILLMYANSVYFGNQVQGIYQASQFYFNQPPSLLSDAQILQLLASISSPSQTNPEKSQNIEIAKDIARRLNLKLNDSDFIEPRRVRLNTSNYSFRSKSFFEIAEFLKSSKKKVIETTIDLSLSEKIREIVFENLQKLANFNAKNAAVLVIKLPENEILTIIGSPDPLSLQEGYQINMATKPRPIGSTIKPFIYLKAFEMGLRPYTLVEDKEYKYITALGFPLYPKNFDYQYRGVVDLHYALSNSLNVPALKVLEYVGLNNFYQFLTENLEFHSVQELDNYQLGIALGVLEMSLFDLAKYFTIFPNNGVLKEVKIFKDDPAKEKIVAFPQYIQLINKILSDRTTGIDQFGLKSELNLFQKNYALKTGTSRDFKDSLIVGYTPDFLVAVWVGNADNSPTMGLSGQKGAGSIWHEVMELLFHSEYNKKTPFDFSLIKEFKNGKNVEYGLENDDYQKIKNILISQEPSLILLPHPNDVFFFEEKAKIILKSDEEVLWFIDGKYFKKGREVVFEPQIPKEYEIKAKKEEKEETIRIFVID